MKTKRYVLFLRYYPITQLVQTETQLWFVKLNYINVHTNGNTNKL